MFMKIKLKNILINSVSDKLFSAALNEALIFFLLQRIKIVLNLKKN
jgi:hypothetical protein